MARVANRIREIRLAKGLSQTKVAVIAGFNQRSVSGWEAQGEHVRQVPLIAALRLAREWGMRVEELVWLEDEGEPGGLGEKG